jgi:carboxypeptidase Q
MIAMKESASFINITGTGGPMNLHRCHAVVFALWARLSRLSRLPSGAGCLLCAAACPGALHAAAPAASALAGQWRVETAVGATSDNGVVTDIMGKGILTITRSASGLAGSIAWLDEQGQVSSTRDMDGRLEGGRAVFTHAGKRVTRGRDGEDVSTEVTVRWTLAAQGERLVGERLVETDEDEPKPVRGQRVAARDVRPLAALRLVAASAPQREPDAAPERGPSTEAERARVLRLAQDAELDPRAAMLRDGAWLDTWVREVPDLTFEPGPAFGWLGAAGGAGTGEVLQFQYTASAMAFQIEQPMPRVQPDAVAAAGMEGALRAYEALLRRDPKQRSEKLDLALSARARGELPAFLAALGGRDPGAAFAGPGRTASDDPVVQAIVRLGTADGRALEWLDILSNRFGGRMAGSDAYTHAAAWARMQFAQWGVQAELEEAGQVAVGFNRGPWMARMVAPREETLRMATPAFTAGTRGRQRGLAVAGPATLDQALARATEFREKWVLIGGRSSGGGRDGEYFHRPRAIMLALAKAGALGTIQAADEPLYSGTAAPTSWDALPTLPDIKLAAAQYDAIGQRTAAGEPVVLEFDIRNWFYPGPVAWHNVVARIPGTDLPDEIVLLGAHLDSFDGATGAADNGAGVATMMEAMRLLAASGAKPRRTIMLVLFGAEELGLKGAAAFAQQHAAALPGVVMMLNRDARPGALSGIAVPPAWGDVFARVQRNLAGVHPVFGFEAGIEQAPRPRNRGNAGSDADVFAAKGILTPRLSALTDFDYEHVHHTVADTYDQVLPFRTAQQFSAIALAIIAHEVANAPAGTGRQPGTDGPAGCDGRPAGSCPVTVSGR